MASEKVTVILGDDGEVQVDFSGFAGQECHREGEEIEADLAALGVIMNGKQKRPKTPEAPAEEVTTSNQRNRVRS